MGRWVWVWLCWYECGWLLRFQRCPGYRARGWSWSQWGAVSTMTSQNTITPVESWMASIMTLTEHLQVHMPPSIHTRYFLTLIQAQPLAQTKRSGRLVRTFQAFSPIEDPPPGSAPLENMSSTRPNPLTLLQLR